MVKQQRQWLIAWFLPLFGYPDNGFFGVKSEKKPFGMAGLIMSVIGLVLTLANSAIGAYMGE